jgi:hypothetical protein
VRSAMTLVEVFSARDAGGVTGTFITFSLRR